MDNLGDLFKRHGPPSPGQFFALKFVISDRLPGKYMAEIQRDLTRIVLSVLFIGVLIGVSLWVLRPFLGAIIWATTIVVATWPILLAVQARLKNSRALAVTVMIFVLLIVLIVPFSLAIGTIVANADAITAWAKTLADFRVPPPPQWLGELPLIGAKAVDVWQQAASKGIEGLATRLAPYAGNLSTWFVAEVGSFGMVVVQFLLTVAVAAILYARGEPAAALIRRFASRLADSRGEVSVRLAAQAIRGVALGVVVTALVQSLLGGLGLALAGVPLVPILTALMFMLAVAQIGAVPVLVVPVIWLYWSGDTGWGTFLLVWTIVVGSLDNILRPILIRQGADLPLLLVLTGVIGGLIAFGLIGIFIGPVVLAVAYTLLGMWMNEESNGETPG
jgi:predicted PurR-regulated permease PerM